MPESIFFKQLVEFITWTHVTEPLSKLMENKKNSERRLSAKQSPWLLKYVAQAAMLTIIQTQVQL